eukprot:TRINITY_DN70759_c0_g1_i1.p2 TRINITY_DN70759_c0_g1~~TRINITY_DN70759_c0_g1_i1.p2  ORF type:complete len:171 (-),score=51.01 TRINITY_DN70759_c0_g1_i1:145-657(-)
MPRQHREGAAAGERSRSRPRGRPSQQGEVASLETASRLVSEPAQEANRTETAAAAVRSAKQQTEQKAEERKKSLAGVFALGGQDDEDEDVPRARLQGQQRRTVAAPKFLPQDVVQPSSAVQRLDPAEIGRRLAEFKRGSVVNGRRVFKQMPEDLRVALEEMQRQRGQSGK